MVYFVLLVAISVGWLLFRRSRDRANAREMAAASTDVPQISTPTDASAGIPAAVSTTAASADRA
jgi:hypothetical protein